MERPPVYTVLTLKPVHRSARLQATHPDYFYFEDAERHELVNIVEEEEQPPEVSVSRDFPLLCTTIAAFCE
jgi:hypothetical protein